MNATRIAALILALAWSLLQSAARADSVAVVSASKDNTIYQSALNNLSGGGAAGIYTGATGGGAPRRGLLAFDIASNVPSGSVITSAQLRMYLGAAPNSNSVNIGLHKLSMDWGEGTAGSSSLSVSGSGGGFAANPGDATWADAKMGSVAWTNLGATGDFDPTASASTTVTGPAETSYTWNSTAALINDVQSWLDTPATNFGWALVNVNEGTNSSVKAFYSRSATQNSSNAANSLDLTWRPTLTVTYVPEPSTAVLCLMACMLPLLRRR